MLAGKVESVERLLKVWWQDATLFCLFFIFYNIHTFIQSHSFNPIILRHSLRPLSISSLLVCSVGNHLPVVPSRESNSGLPYSKPTRYQLSHAAPYYCCKRAILCLASSKILTPHPPLRPASACTPRLCWWGRTHSPVGVWGWGVNILEDAGHCPLTVIISLQ